MGKTDYRQNKRIRNLEKNVRRIKQQQELKYTDTLITNLDAAVAGSLTLLNGIAVGDNQNTRDGAEIHCTSLQLRIAYTEDVGEIVPWFVRCIVFWDNQANGAAPTVGGNPIGGVTALLNTNIVTAAWLAPYQYENKERFKVLYDNTITINPLLAANGTGRFVYKKIKLNRLTKYGDDINTIGGINTNSLYICFITEVVSLGLIDFSARLYFKDS